VFRLFLDNERKRAERSKRSLLLVLVELASDGEGGPSFDSGAASALFKVLGSAVREADFVGWYRDRRTAAAALPQTSYGPPPDVSYRIGERVTRALREGLPAPLGRRIEVRVLQLNAMPQDRHA
jgi:hypothetical protein